MIEGKFPKRAMSLVMEWYEEYKSELMDNWESIKNDGTFTKIKPLE